MAKKAKDKKRSKRRKKRDLERKRSAEFNNKKITLVVNVPTDCQVLYYEPEVSAYALELARSGRAKVLYQWSLVNLLLGLKLEPGYNYVHFNENGNHKVYSFGESHLECNRFVKTFRKQRERDKVLQRSLQHVEMKRAIRKSIGLKQRQR